MRCLQLVNQLTEERSSFGPRSASCAEVENERRLSTEIFAQNRLMQSTGRTSLNHNNHHSWNCWACSHVFYIDFNWPVWAYGGNISDVSWGLFRVTFAAEESRVVSTWLVVVEQTAHVLSEERWQGENKWEIELERSLIVKSAQVRRWTPKWAELTWKHHREGLQQLLEQKVNLETLSAALITDFVKKVEEFKCNSWRWWSMRVPRLFLSSSINPSVITLSTVLPTFIGCIELKRA